jgi:poly-gamma-glutamate synthesis protein (capsule biosynthesis protein)
MGQSRSGSVSLVGDLMLMNHLSDLLQGEETGFKGALAAATACDVATANLEMPLSNRGSKVLKFANLRSAPEIIDDVREMGFQAVSLANNHLMDYGPEALLDTVAACEGANILNAGAGKNLEAAMAPAWLDAGGRRIAFVSVASTLPHGFEATDWAPGIAPVRVDYGFEVDSSMMDEQPGTAPKVRTWVREEYQDAICNHVRSLAEQADDVIVAIHWGVPTVSLTASHGLLAEYQQPLGHALIDAGATVVFGHHSHSIHGIEVYKGRPIFYSAGNFIFEEPFEFMQPESYVAQVSFGDELSVDIVPLMVDERGLPYLTEGAEAAAVLDLLEELSKPFGTTFERKGDRAEILIG